MCCGSSSYGLSLKNQKPRTYLGQLLGICQIVHGDSQEDVQERICWRAAKEKPSHSKYSKWFLFCYHYPSFPVPTMVYYGQTPHITALSSSFPTHPLLLDQLRSTAGVGHPSVSSPAHVCCWDTLTPPHTGFPLHFSLLLSGMAGSSWKWLILKTTRMHWVLQKSEAEVSAVLYTNGGKRS